MKFPMIFEAQIADASRAAEFQVMHECAEQAVLAEPIAMLDISSRGRVDFGIGKVGTSQEGGAFQTRLLDPPPRPIIPPPYQQPHPPLCLGFTHEAILNQAGGWGASTLPLGFAGPEDICK